jgi:pyruvate dehydrogenase E2 component (dihydrolipoamide acetyltransferase)
MAEKMLMLALSPTMEKGTLARWLKKEGDTISQGDLVCEVETDKAVMEYESVQEGTLLKILVSQGQEASVGDPIAIVGKAGEDVTPLLNREAKAPPSPAPPASAGAGESPTAPQIEAARPGDGRRVKASPLARKIAGEKGVNISLLKGSGPGGRVVRRDVEESLAHEKTGGATHPEAAGRVIPVSPKRKVIAERLSTSMFSAPHYYLKTSINMEEILEARVALNRDREEKVSLNAFILKFAGEALKRHPIINSTWNGDTITLHPAAHIGLAVAQADGLITPVIRDCAGKGILAINDELRELVARARENRLRPEEYTGATFTVSNLGSYGIEEFTAIINPPGSAILAVGSIIPRPVYMDEGEGMGDEEGEGGGELAVLPLMTVTLSCDHRVIDGAAGARFLRDFREMMENPVQALY